MVVKFFRYLHRFPKTILSVCVLLTLFFYFQIQWNMFAGGSLKIDSSMEPFIASGSASYSAFKQARDQFGNEEVLVVALSPAAGGKPDLAFFQAIDRLTREIPGRHPQIESVASLTNTPQLDGPCAGKSYLHRLEIGDICVSALEKLSHQLACLKAGPAAAPAPGPADAEDALADTLDADVDDPADEPVGGPADELADGLPASTTAAAAPAEAGARVCTADIMQKSERQVREEAERSVAEALRALARNPFIQRDLISSDGETAALLIGLRREVAIDSDGIIRSLAELFRSVKEGGLQIAYAGQTRQAFESSGLIRDDIKRILPLSLLLMVLVLGGVFRSLSGVIVPLVVVLTGVTWVAGIFSLVGERLNLVTMAFPAILISVGSAYVIFLINQYYSESAEAGLSKSEIIANTIDRVTVPLGVTALTTVAGFAALMVSPIPAIQQLGLYASIGIVAIILLSLTLAPVLLSLFPRPKPLDAGSRNKLLDRILSLLAEKLGRHSRRVTVAWIVVGVVMSIGILRVSVDSTSTNFARDAPIMQDLAFIEERLAGTNSLRIVFQAKADPADLQSARTIRGVQDLENWLMDKEGAGPAGGIEGVRIDKVYSPAVYLSYFRQGLDGLKDGEVVDFFQKLEARNGPTFLNAGKDRMQITARMKISGSTAFLKLRDELDRKIPQFLPHLTAIYTGSGVLASESADNIARGQIQSVALALGIIFVILSSLFLSWRIGIIALYPNIVALTIFFGTLGWLSIPIGVTISVIASIALGIGVDDTIHFLVHYNENVKRTRDKRSASQITLRHIAKPMVFTTAALSLGFIVFVLSDMESQVLFGALIAYTLLACLATDTTFLPAVVMETKLITVWDYVGLKFDQAFVRSIDLFKHMSVREAKIATLMAYTWELGQGEVLFEQGAVGNELYVVLSGNVRVYLKDEQSGRETTLAHLDKGRTFGEMGLFRNATRMACVQATEQSRMLVISEEVLSKLRRRYPTVATKLFLNLSSSLSETIKNMDYRVVGQVFRGDGDEPADRGTADLSHIGERDERDVWAYYSNIFDDMTGSQIDRLIKICRTEEVPKGTTVFSTGDRGDYLLIVTRGKFRVLIESDEGQVAIAEVGRLEVIGEMAMLSEDKVRQATVVAKEDSEVLYLDEASLFMIMEKDKRLAAQFSYNMVSMLSDRLEATNVKLQTVQ